MHTRSCHLSALSIFAIAIVALSANVACRSPRSSLHYPDAPVPLDKELVWQLVALRGKALRADAAGSATTLVFNPEAATFRGEGPCNDYGGEYALRLVERRADGDLYDLRLTLHSPLSTTQCPDAEMNAESRYLALLGRADRMLLSAYSVVLYQRDKEIARYELR